ncbi:LemA family protein [Niabella drilacis]|uniref:LemA protein n=1 Tax=Niabella drilacis (strain DSM 25811 / CCM 8410 / CCUG 62505 / LMG 26954 / E90) TaxID=1285928 RepID=A0A1G6THT4_NIADE|nr:LemA family protein [Niabella drilacis]SDD28076.1 LemA protein [Niabella drilacis]
MKGVTLVIVILLVILGFMGCKGYNGLVKEQENVNNAWSNVQSEYQKRNDLVDNLVETVKGAANFEKSTLTDVINARAKATSVQVNPENLTPEKLAEFQAAQGQMTSALGRLLVTVEAYPELKANQNFLQLQGQLEGLENDIRASRRTFNTAVNNYNVKVRSFPMNILGGIFGFHAKEGFKADPGADKAPKVKF